jgi:hypothetical protein
MNTALAAALCFVSAAALAQPAITTLDFDAVDATHDRVAAASYLSGFGITLSDVSAGTLVVVVNAKSIYEGRALVPTSQPNVLTQINSNDPVSFRLNLPRPMASVRFVRPALLAGPTGITFPEWRAEALDANGLVLDAVGEPLGSGPKYYSNVAARSFALKGPGIQSVRFSSKNYHFAGFSAVVIDDLVLESQ